MSLQGWAGAIKFDPTLWAEFETFRQRSDTFSLGVCNGCQLMALLGWIPAKADGALYPEQDQPRFVENTSGKFESRWLSLQVSEESPAVLLRDMVGSTLGVWVAHGEGRLHFPSSALEDHILQQKLAPLRFATCALPA